MEENHIWVGSMKATGALLVYDPHMQVRDSSFVYLYSIQQERMREFDKEHVRAIMTTVTNSSRELAILGYRRWKKSEGEAFVAAEAHRVEDRRQDALTEVSRREKYRSDVIDRHRDYLSSIGKSDSGHARNSHRPHRSTHCYKCRQTLDSSLDLECSSCNWLVCACGACGCGYVEG